MLDTNVLGAIWVTQAVLPHLRIARLRAHRADLDRRRCGHDARVRGVQREQVGARGVQRGDGRRGAPIGVRVTIAELGGFATDWGGSSMHFAEPLPAYDQLRTDLFGTPVVPWEQPADDAPATDAPPAVAARAIRAHVEADAGPLRLLVGDDAPTFVAMALAARRDDYGRDPGSTGAPPAGPTAV